MSYSKHRLKEVVELQKGILERIESDLGEFHLSSRLKYIQEFTNEFRNYRSVCGIDEIVETASDAQVVWIGDYHALSRSRDFTADFLKRLQARKRSKLALGVEMVFARRQKTLDRFLAGKISESEFLDAIHYDDEWGCDWPSYKALFNAARELGIPVYGIDCHPRRDLRSIRRRDQGVARRVAKLVLEDSSRTIVALFGESHLASTHLPQRVHRILAKNGLMFTDVLVLQNIDELYWRVQEQGVESAQAVEVDARRYCVFNATPLEKYESFRQYLNDCTGDDESSGDWTRFVHTLIDGMSDFLDIEKRPALLDYLPKVYSELSADSLPQFLSQHELPHPQIRILVDHFHEHGASYIPELNSMFIERFNLDSTVEETARFIYHACRGRLKNRSETESTDLFFTAVFERALGYFCSKLLHSSRDGIEALGERVLNYIGYNDEFARTVPYLLDPGKKPSAAHFEKLKAALEEHAGRYKLIRMLSLTLGYALGRRLYRAYLESRISRKEIQALFHDPLPAPQDALSRYVELNNRLA